MIFGLDTKKIKENKAYKHSYDEFIKSYAAYGQTSQIDRLREKEFSRLDEQGQGYIDFTGGGLYANKQITEHTAKLHPHVLGNPHSSNPTSQKATEVTESARRYVLKYFNQTPEK